MTLSCSLKESSLFLSLAHAIPLPRMLFSVPILTLSVLSVNHLLREVFSEHRIQNNSQSYSLLHWDIFTGFSSSAIILFMYFFYSLISVFLQHCELPKIRYLAPLFTAEGADVLPRTCVLYTHRSAHCPPSLLPEFASRHMPPGEELTWAVWVCFQRGACCPAGKGCQQASFYQFSPGCHLTCLGALLGVA